MAHTGTMAGRRILITRTRQQASELAARLEALGAETISIPTIEVAEPQSWCGLDAALACLRSFDWVVFTSANAVRVYAGRARLLGLRWDARRIAVIGPATARAIRECGLAVDLMPERYVAEGLLEALLREDARGQVLLVRAAEARDVLPDGLRAAGREVTVAVAYRNVVPADAPADLRNAFNRGVDAITFTSSSTATNFFALMASAGLTLPQNVALASIGPVTSATLRELGHEPTTEAREPSIDGLVEAILVIP